MRYVWSSENYVCDADGNTAGDVDTRNRRRCLIHDTLDTRKNYIAQCLDPLIADKIVDALNAQDLIDAARKGRDKVRPAADVDELDFLQ